MAKMKELDDNEYKWAVQHDPHTWARCYFSTHTKSDALQNNICESFNSYMEGKEFTNFENVLVD